MGDFPWMTERGTFIINGTERVVVTQLVRSPGAYVMAPKDPEKQVFIANLMPARGSWLELEIDKKGRVYVRIDRKRKLPVTVLLRAMGYVEDEQILKMFDDSVYLKHTIAGRHRGDADRRGRPDRAVQKAAPGRAALGRRRQGPARAALLRPQALRPDPGRPLQAERPPRPRHRPRQPGPHPRRHHRPDQGAGQPAEAARHPRGDRRGEPDQGLRGGGDHLPARARRRAPRRVRALRQPPPAHRRRADPGGLPDRPLPDGARRPRAAHHRRRRRDHPADDHQHPPGGRGAEGVLRLLAALAVHGPDQLAGRPHPPPPPLGARRRRPDPRAGPDRGARRAPDPLRPDVPDRDAGGPEHRPDRLALLLRADLRARLRHHPLPGGQGRRRQRGDRPPGRHPGGGNGDRPGERRDRREDPQAEGPAGAGPRRRAGVRDRDAQGSRTDGRLADPDLVGGDGADPVPRARRRQPGADGLEHAAPGGAAAETRAAADRHRDGAPRRGRHRRRHPGRQRRRGHPRRLGADRRQPRLEERRVPAEQVHALQPGDDHPPAADRQERPAGEGRRRARRRLLDRGRRDRPRQELPGRLHVLGGLQLRGRDHPLRAPGQGRRDDLDPHRGVRDRRPHDQARRRGDHPRHPQPLRGEPAQPRRARHRPRRRRGHLRRPPGRQGDAEGRDRADRRGEADPRDLQGEGARGPRHLAEGPARRGRRRDRRAHLQPRRRRRPAARRQRPGPRLRRDQAQDRRGRQARRPPREQGCDLEDRARRGHAPPRRRHPGRRDPQPARRAEPDEHRPGAGDAPRLGRRRTAGTTTAPRPTSRPTPTRATAASTSRPRSSTGRRSRTSTRR